MTSILFVVFITFKSDVSSIRYFYIFIVVLLKTSVNFLNKTIFNFSKYRLFFKEDKNTNVEGNKLLCITKNICLLWH